MIHKVLTAVACTVLLPTGLTAKKMNPKLDDICDSMFFNRRTDGYLPCRHKLLTADSRLLSGVGLV
jgi:hypothetical protein